MALSAKMKLRIFIAALIVVIIVIGGSIGYFNFYVKTPEYTLKAVQDAVENHDIDEFNRYVDVDNVVAGVTNNMLDAIIASQSNLPEEAKVAMNSLATMFKAPLVASINDGLTTFVKTGNWETTDVKDSQGAMIDSKMVLDQTGLMGISFSGIDYINIDEENGTAQAGIKVEQSEIGQPFVFKITLEEQPDGYWKVVSVDNFADFIKALQAGRQKYIADYLNQTATLLSDKEKILTENEAKLNATLKSGVLGNDKSRMELKLSIEENILPQLKQLQAVLQEVEVPKVAETLHNLQLKTCESKIAYYENYAKWLENKDIKTLREATDNMKKANTMEHEAQLLKNRIQGQLN